MFDSNFHGHQSMKLQLTYEIRFGYVQILQIAHLIPLKTINIISYNKFSELWPGRFLGLTRGSESSKDLLFFSIFKWPPLNHHKQNFTRNFFNLILRETTNSPKPLFLFKILLLF